MDYLLLVFLLLAGFLVGLFVYSKFKYTVGVFISAYIASLIGFGIVHLISQDPIDATFFAGPMVYAVATWLGSLVKNTI